MYEIRLIALRFLTMYGPRQRPDLAIHKLAHLMIEGKQISFFGDGFTRRNYTYIDDIVSDIRAAMDYTSTAYEIINLGNNHTMSLSEMVGGLELLGMKATLDRQPELPRDVPRTWSDISKAWQPLGYELHIDFFEGAAGFSSSYPQSLARGNHNVKLS